MLLYFSTVNTRILLPMESVGFGSLPFSTGVNISIVEWFLLDNIVLNEDQCFIFNIPLFFSLETRIVPLCLLLVRKPQ